MEALSALHKQLKTNAVILMDKHLMGIQDSQAKEKYYKQLHVS